MKAILFAESEQAALELASAAQSLGASQIIQVVIGGGSGSGSGTDDGSADADASLATSAAQTIATLALPNGAAYEDAYPSVKAWFDEQNADLVLSEPTRRLKIVVGRLAASKAASVISNITALDAGQAQTMYFGGMANKSVKPLSQVGFYYVGSGLFEPAAAASSPASSQIAWVSPQVSLEVLGRQELVKGQTDLSKSDVVIACGRGFQEHGDVDLASDLATKLAAGLGCTRPLTEQVDWFSREAYIGVSGQMIKPKVYIGIGVSGQMQHMVGTNTADVIIAINKDKDAPIFKQCDLGIVGDLKQVLPVLIAAV